MLPEDLLVPDRTLPSLTRACRMVDPTATMILSEPIKVLRMSLLAICLSITILTWPLVTAIIIFFIKERYFPLLLQGVDTVANVALMIAGSDAWSWLSRRRLQVYALTKGFG